MPGVEEQTGPGALQLIAEALDRLFEARLVRIDSQFNLETELLQGFGQSARVIGRIR
jgi:DNA-binding TFAR19-related protein (PDSD5 family)